MSTPITSDKAKLAAARGLINEKRYREARNLLTTVHDPQAVDWIMKIDAMPQHESVSATRPQSRGIWGAISLIAFVVAVGCILLAVTNREYANQVFGGLVGIISLLIAYFSRRMAQ